MPTTRGWALHGNVVNAISYILDLQNGQAKTDEGILVDWNGPHTISPYSAGYAWTVQQLESRSAAKSKIVGYHLQQSFEPGSVTAEEALEISREWIEDITDGKCEYVLAVHTNTDIIHTHIIINPIQTDGKRWDVYWKKDRLRFREASDRISQKHGLRILESTAAGRRSYFEWMKDLSADEPELIKRVLNYLIPRVASYKELKEALDKLGFACKDGGAFDQYELSDEKLVCFTVNSVLLDQSVLKDPEHLPDQICIRIPFKKDQYIWIPKESFSWIQTSVNARIVIPETLIMKAQGFASEEIPASMIRDSFNMNEKNRSGLRIKVPGSRRYLKTKYLSGDLDLESVKARIGRREPSALVDGLLAATKFEKIQECRRQVLSAAGITLSYESCTSYLSKRQQAYYQALAQKCETRRNQLAYHKLLLNDRSHLPALQNRKAELIKEIDELNSALSECEEYVLELEKDILSETGEISQNQLDAYITETIAPLREQKEKCRELIGMYSERIHRVQKEEQARKEDRGKY